MEPTQQTNTPIEAGTGTTPLPREKSSLGVLVTLIIVIALIVVGAFYLFKERRSEIKNGTDGNQHIGCDKDRIDHQVF